MNIVGGDVNFASIHFNPDCKQIAQYLEKIQLKKKETLPIPMLGSSR
jgi:hypothetical protein